MNYKNKYFIFLLTLLSLTSCYSFAQDSISIISDSSATLTDIDSGSSVVIDTSVIATNSIIENDSIVKWKSSHEFAYMVYLDSLLHKRKDIRSDTISIETKELSRSKSISRTNDNAKTNGLLNSLPVKMIFWILAIGFIAFILYRIFFKIGLFAGGKTKDEEEVFVEEPEKLNEFSEYDRLINEAESRKDFNLATRYLYLKTLKRLSEKELIVFSPNKINKSYVQELAGRNYQKQFESLTYNYEYLWYGKFAIEDGIYQKLKEQFFSFNRNV